MVAFSGRKLREEQGGGKYINSPETPVFNKSRTMYGLYQGRQGLRKMREAIILEGQMDVIACHQAGLEHVTAPLGTALTDSHVRILKRYADKIFLVFDGDEAGLKASERATKTLFEEELPFRVMILGAGLDPFDIIQEEGGEAFVEKMTKSLDGAGFVQAVLKRRFDLGSMDGKVAAAGYIVEMAGYIKNTHQQMVFLKELAPLVGLNTHDELLKQLKNVHKRVVRKEVEVGMEKGRNVPTVPRLGSPEETMARVLDLLLEAPDLVRVERDIIEQTVSDFDEPYRLALSVLLSIYNDGKTVDRAGLVNSLLNEAPETDWGFLAHPLWDIDQDDQQQELLRKNLKQLSERKNFVSKADIGSMISAALKNGDTAEVQRLMNLKRQKFSPA